MQIKIIQKPKPCKGWESWCEAVTLAGMMLVIGRDKSAEIGWFETRLIDAQNAAEVAQKLGL
ncbi:MAG: hypothetical protein A2W59_00490 [Candidatus Terrybacteria bacterium RIFCSPHIGHO2_02_41_19]|nr:MAG: hypothetical protein A2W59_00490 [Candidatus Terrybacteria bacterium RIFCSPHIGHO2_02_41_19]